MSEFDPQELNLSPLRRRLRRFVPERHFMIRSGGALRTFTLTSGHQLMALAVALLVFGWLTYATVAVMWMDDILQAKNGRITDARDAYKSLLAEVSVYKTRVAEVTRALEDNHAQFSHLVDSEDAARTPAPVPPADPEGTAGLGQEGAETGASFLQEQRRYDREHQTLMAQLNTLEQGMADLSQARVLLTDFDGIELEMRKVMIQRDLALSENRELQSKLDELQDHVRVMEEAQVRLVERFADVAGNRAAQITRDLGRTGLDVDSLLHQRLQGGRPFGQGGPFVPVDQQRAANTHPEYPAAVAALGRTLEQWNQIKALTETLPLKQPLDGAIEVTSAFGVRSDPFFDLAAVHEGIDLGAPVGDPVRATAPGKVVYAAWRGRYGRVVEIDHGLGMSTRYAHLDTIDTVVGQIVHSGDVIGTVGESGRSTGPHLHYEVRVNGEPRDPAVFMKAGNNVLKG
ncbi:M23 family metallopeptidase [Pararhodospirillum oryzae]|uniref:Peptidase M23 n=1 Tax=Pararhodospirillum oryzae TaxID=478448 RepID=A0A512HBA2_9PROT|nr:M23 family metallopeptidase [Pararhodospirillum oryzae]GEO82715.1 peptidase M23 [Pararhodospirillum oryzae]